MKNIVIVLLTAISILCAGGTVAAAGGFGLDKTAGAAGYETTGASATLAARVQLVVSVILGLVAVVFFGLTLYGGIIWMTARGKEDKVAEAKNILEAAAIGLAVIGASYAIATFVISRVGAGETGCCASGSGSEMNFEYLDKSSCENKGGNWAPGDC